MNKKEWEARNKLIDKKVSKTIKPLADSLILEFDLNDRSAYGSIVDAANNLKYEKNVFAITKDLKALIKKREELESVRDIVWDELQVVEKQIKQLKREELKINKLLSNFNWQISLRERIFDIITLSIKDRDISDDLQKRLDAFFGSWGGSECIYMFDDGREISCYHNRDDAELNLSLNIKKISSKEVLEAFNELGIKISFDGIQASIEEKKERLKRYEDLIAEFKV